jgi:hypothetical protein
MSVLSNVNLITYKRIAELVKLRKLKKFIPDLFLLPPARRRARIDMLGLCPVAGPNLFYRSVPLYTSFSGYCVGGYAPAICYEIASWVEFFGCVT